MQKFYTVMIMLVLTLIIRSAANHFHPGLGNFIFMYSAINCLLGLIPAFIAKKRGGSFIKWWVFGWLLFVPAIIGVTVYKKHI